MLSMILSFVLINGPDPIRLCSIQELSESPGYVWSPDRVVAKVDSATHIVRVKAISADSVTRSVTLQRVEWIRGGTDTIHAFIMPGIAVEHDDFNAHAVPYQMVRPAGARGSCFADEYRLGREYLLLLKFGAGIHPIRWWPLGPVNEQLRGEDDPWLHWVRARVAQTR